MKNKIIDTHIHLDLKQYGKTLDIVISRAFDSGIDKMIIPGIKSNDMNRILSIVDKYENIYFATGNHPNYLDSFDYQKTKELTTHKKCVAIGECGLDWFRIPKGSNFNDVKKNQIDVFRQQIELSIESKKPLILHSRDTDEDMVNTLLDYKNDLIGGVIHCYVGSKKLLELEKHGFYYGIGGIITYKSAIDLRENIKNIPLDKLIIETDGPYLTPQQMKGKSKFNEPSFTPYIVKEISKILNKDYSFIQNNTYKNTQNLFGI
jgi:TatD DNase family protein